MYEYMESYDAILPVDEKYVASVVALNEFCMCFCAQISIDRARARVCAGDRRPVEAADARGATHAT